MITNHGYDEQIDLCLLVIGADAKCDDTYQTKQE